MEKILDAFVDDQLHVNAVTEKRTSHHQYLCEQVEILQSKLEKKLNDEDRELLKKLADTYFDESCCDAHNNFVRGYRLGVLMTMGSVSRLSLKSSRKAEKPLPHNPLSPMPKTKAKAVQNDKGKNTGKPR